jgi:hypothetical protein
MFDSHPEKPVGRIPPSVMGGTNSDLMAAIADLYLAGSVMDVTYGRGGWWQRFTPEPFIRHDLYTLDGVDFRHLPEADDSVDTVCFDPPYVASGGESSAVLGTNFQDAYGIGGARTGYSVKGIEALIADGVTDCVRVAHQFGLVKCMEFAQGSYRGFHDIPHLVTTAALAAGARKHDQIVHHTGSGPGGHNIFDTKRARRHHSYLIVFAKG